MGSRICENPGKVFEVFVEVAKPDNGQDAFILQRYPEDYDNMEVLKEIPKFIYPCEIDCSNVDHFTFVFTNLEGNFMFGFCRHATGAQTCLCIISFLPWFEVFYKQLNLMAEILNRTENNDLTPLLESTSMQDIPMPGVPVTIVAKQEMFSFTSPDLSQLPSIPASRNLTEYYNAIDTNNMMVIFASMLNERRVIFTSKKLSRLTACIHGAECLLYPMHWQHLYIPVLPMHLIDYVTAPMPFVIGVHSAMMKKVRSLEIADAIIVDTDKNTVETEHNDLEMLPEEVSSYLKKYLKGDRVKSSMMVSGDAISRAFLDALVRLIGGYRDALKFRTGEPITFDRDAFVSTRNPSMKDFLENMLQLQIFEQFIKDRLEILNSGSGFSDLFEKEAVLHADKLNTQSKYREWASNMKRHGKKFQKGGKDAFSEVKEKAPYMVNSAVQSIKFQGKKRFSEMKAKISEMNESTKKSSHSHHTRIPHRERPTTIIGSEIKSSRPPRPPLPQTLREKGAELSRPITQYKLIRGDSDEVLPGNDEHQFEYQRVSVSLLSDPDIQNAYQQSPSTDMISDDSSSTETPSSGSQTPAEIDGSSIPYVDLGSNISQPKPKYSPVARRNDPKPASRKSLYKTNGDPSNTAAIPPPIPMPRSRLKHISHPPLRPPQRPKEEQLIRFESTESEPDTEFDPLASSRKPSPASPTAGATATCDDSPRFERTTQRRSLVNRSPAFRQQGQDTPKRNAYKPDRSPENSEVDDPSLLFDPLAGFDKAMYSSSSSKGHLPQNTGRMPGVAGRSTSPELLQDWSFNKLVASPSVTPPLRNPSPTPATSTTSSMRKPAYSMHVPGPHIAAPPPKPRLSKYNPSQSASSSLHKQAKQPPGEVQPTSDPFSDLIGLDIGPRIQKSPTPQKAQGWETFE